MDPLAWHPADAAGLATGSSPKAWRYAPWASSLTVQYDRVMYLLDDTPVSRTLMHEYVEVVEYPDGVIEVQASGVTLPYRQYVRITRIDQGAEIENKRLASALQVARQIQAMRDERRASGSPSRTHCGEEVRAKQALIALKKQRAIDVSDINHAVLEASASIPCNSNGAFSPHSVSRRAARHATAHSNDLSRLYAPALKRAVMRRFIVLMRDPEPPEFATQCSTTFHGSMSLAR